MKNYRDAIPSNIKRQVRRNCHFSCVMCDDLICEIDHIEEWSVVREHNVENLVLLCGKHHIEKTKGLLAKDHVRSAYENRRTNIPDWVRGSRIYKCPYTLIVGGNRISKFQGRNIVLAIDRCIFLMIEKYLNGKFVVTGQVSDRNGNIVLKIIENELVFGTNAWDLEVIGNTYIIRQASRNVLLDLTLDAEKNEVVVKGSFDVGMRKQIIINDEGVKLGRKHVLAKNCEVINCEVAIVVNQEDVNWPTAAYGSFHVLGFHVKNCDIAFRQVLMAEHCIVENCKVGFMWSTSIINGYL